VKAFAFYSASAQLAMQSVVLVLAMINLSSVRLSDRLSQADSVETTPATIMLVCLHWRIAPWLYSLLCDSDGQAP